MKRSMTHMNTFLILMTAALISLTSCGCSRVSPADLVLRGGKIATVDESFSFAEAVAVEGDRIIHVGSNEEIEPYIDTHTHVIELKGKLVVPGLIDAHAHLTGYGMSLNNLDFRGTTSFQPIVDMVAKKVKNLAPGEWILGRGWDQNDWDEKKFPTHETLTLVTPQNPVWLTRIDGHAGIANKKAMDIAGITEKTKEPEGGEIHRMPNGDPTGVFIDRAMGLISSKIPGPSTEQTRESIVLAAESCLAAGLTGIHDAGASPRTI